MNRVRTCLAGVVETGLCLFLEHLYLTFTNIFVTMETVTWSFLLCRTTPRATFAPITPLPPHLWKVIWKKFDGKVEVENKRRWIAMIDILLITSYFNHPDILIRKPIRSSKNLRIHPKNRSGGTLGNSYFDPDKTYAKTLYQEMIRRLQLLIGREISLIRRINVSLPDNWGRTFNHLDQSWELYL